jgi:transposase
LSVISAVTASGKVYFGMEERALLSEDVIRFVRRVQRYVGKPLLLIWDGAGIHTSKVVRRALSEGLSPGVWLERLPPYAPDLNPDEGIWSYLKRRLANVCCTSLEDLKAKLRREISRLRPKSQIVLSCFAGAGLAL